MKTMNYSIIRCICALVLGRIIGSMARSCYPVFGDYYRSFVFGTRSVLCLWLSYSWKAEWNVFSYSRIG